MNVRKMLIFALAAAGLIGVVAVSVQVYNARPLTEREILAADKVEFERESPLTDGGSFGFFFRLPHNRWLEITVVHRHPDYGGNTEFQQILLYRFPGPDPYMQLQPGSALEKQLLGLLQAASISTNTPDPTRPTPERLQWLITRITDRKTIWGPTNAIGR